MNSVWQLLVVDDEKDVANTTAELLTDLTDEVQTGPRRAVAETSFEQALVTLANQRFDLLVLDVRHQAWPEGSGRLDQASDEGLDEGLMVFENIRSRRFIPIIFYTALPYRVQSLSKPPFVQVVSKMAADPIADLRGAVDVAVGSGLPRLHRAIEDHVERVVRRFMGEFVENQWDGLVGHDLDLAHLLSRSLARSLEGGAGSLASDLGQLVDVAEIDLVHAMRYYIVPPTSDRRMGDLLVGPDVLHVRMEEDSTSFWYVVLTPSCDLVRDGKNADHVILARCLPIEDFDEYSDWVKGHNGGADSPSDRSSNRLKKFLRSEPEKRQKDRYFYLPAAWRVPHLVVDLQRVVYVERERIESYEKMASIDSPFAEELSYRFGRYVGRVGTPDLDVEAVLRRMTPEGPD